VIAKLLIWGTLAGCIYAFGYVLVLSEEGWGLPGYEGYYVGRPMFYNSRVSYYHDPSIRAGSLSGTSHRGGGLGGGK